jgi:hypothetical protein
MEDIASWAYAEVGHAELPDERNVTRLCTCMVGAATKPGGRVTQVFQDPAQREGAYRFLENPRIKAAAILDAHGVALARRAAAFPYVYVAIDQSAIQVTDHSGHAFGPLAGKHTNTGAQAMSALVVAPDGVPLGLSALEFWTRSIERVPAFKDDDRSVDERETRFWLAAISQTATLLQTAAPGTLPWLQLDRGADSPHVLLHLAKVGVAYTVRACNDRRVQTRRGQEALFAAVRRKRVLGTYQLAVQRPHGPCVVTIEVRAMPVKLKLAVGTKGRGPHHPLRVTVVEARELGGGDGTAPVLWRLLTNRRPTTFDEARAVIAGYTMRWRVEEFHLAWKSGACRIEDTRLRSLEAFAKWATMLAIVAVRAERLKTLSRETPDVPALVEFSPDEIEAVILLRQPKHRDPDVTPTLGQLVRWIADIGGYTGKSSGGPPGVRIISRALIEVEAVARALGNQRANRTSG